MFWAALWLASWQTKPGQQDDDDDEEAEEDEEEDEDDMDYYAGAEMDDLEDAWVMCLCCTEFNV